MEMNKIYVVNQSSGISWDTEDKHHVVSFLFYSQDVKVYPHRTNRFIRYPNVSDWRIERFILNLCVKFYRHLEVSSCK